MMPTPRQIKAVKKPPNKTNTKQLVSKKKSDRNADGKFKKGRKPNAGFDKHPENRSDGRWKKEESLSYLYNRFGRMSREELKNYKPKTDFEEIALARLKAARNPNRGLNDTKEITDRTEGKAPQSIDLTTGGKAFEPVVVEFIDSAPKNTDTK